MSTLYDILEVSPQASDDEIKKSYRRLAMVYHPDKNKMPGAQERFIIIQDAYELLSDKYKRQQYDIMLAYRKANNMDTSGTHTQSSTRNTYTNQQRSTQDAAYRARQQQAREEESRRQRKEQEESYQRRRAASFALKKINDARLFVMLKAVNYVFIFIALLYVLDGILPEQQDRIQYVTHFNFKNFHTENYSFRPVNDEDFRDYTHHYLDLETTSVFGFVHAINGIDSNQLKNPIPTDYGPQRILLINIIVVIIGLILEFYWAKNIKFEILVPALSFINFLIITIDFFMTFDVMS